MKNKEWYFLFLKNTNKILIDIRCLLLSLYTRTNNKISDNRSLVRRQFNWSNHKKYEVQCLFICLGVLDFFYIRYFIVDNNTS